jgi:hypothetical protein
MAPSRRSHQVASRPPSVRWVGALQRDDSERSTRAPSLVTTRAPNNAARPTIRQHQRNPVSGRWPVGYLLPCDGAALALSSAHPVLRDERRIGYGYRAR